MFSIRRKLLLFCLLLAAGSVFVQAQNTEPALLNIDRIFDSEEFQPQFVSGLRWLKSGDAYSKLEPSPTVKGGTDLVSYDAATNTRTVLIPAERLVPTGATAPLAVNGYEWSADNRQMRSTRIRKRCGG